MLWMIQVMYGLSGFADRIGDFDEDWLLYLQVSWAVCRLVSDG